jgi:hypothetical protein
MCVRLFTNSDFADDLKLSTCQASVTTVLLHDAITFLHGPDDRVMETSEVFCRNVTGTLTFLILAVASVVEGAARIALGLIALLPCYIASCLMEDKNIAWLPISWLAEGVVDLIDQPIRCMVACAKACGEEHFTYENLAPCECLDWKPIT